MSNEIDELMKSLGHAVYEAQETEATLHLCMSVVLGLSIADSIEHLKKIYQKKTLGQFLQLLRTKVGLKEGFDDSLKSYIDRRNFLVHNLSRASIYSIHSEEGRANLKDHLCNFRLENRKVNLIFVALTDVWLKHISPEYKASEQLKISLGSELFAEISNEYIPELRNLFGQNT
jgi:uncharacterized protein YutE (UPF0331/DUF86 family)